MSSYGNTSPWLGSIGRWWCGRLCWGSGRRRRGVCWGIRWNASIAIDDPDVCAVDKCFLFSFPHATVIRTIASPAVCHAPPPLYHATITCQPRGKLHLDRKHLIFVRIHLPCLYNVCQLLLGNRWRPDRAHTECKSSLMVRGNVHLHFNLLAFSVGLGNDTCGVFPRVCVHSLALFKMIWVTANATLPTVFIPLRAETATIEFVIRDLSRCVKTVPPGGVSACRINQSTVPQCLNDQTERYKVTKDRFHIGVLSARFPSKLLSGF